MELLLTPEEIEHQQQETKSGQKKVARTEHKMTIWQATQKADLQSQYDVAVKKIETKRNKKKNQVELAKYRLKAKEGLNDFDRYQEKLLENKLWIVENKLTTAKLAHQRAVEDIKKTASSDVAALNKTCTELINHLKANKDLVTVTAMIDEKYQQNLNEAQLRKENRIALAKTYHDESLARATRVKNHAIKARKRRLNLHQNEDPIADAKLQFEKELKNIEQSTAKRIANAKATYEQDIQFYEAKHASLIERAKTANYDGFTEKKAEIETRYANKVNKVNQQAAAKIKHENKILAQAQAKHDQQVARIKTNHAIKAQKAHDQQAQRTPLNADQLKKLQMTNQAIINDLQQYQNDQVASYDHQLDLLTQNLNQGIVDIDDGAKANISQTQNSSVNKVNRKYDKKNFQANYKKEANKLIEEDNWNYRTSHQLLVELYDRSDKNYTPLSILTTDFYKGQKSKFKDWVLNTKIKFARCREWSFKEWINLKIWGMPLYIYAAVFGIAVAVLATGYAQINMIYPAFILFAISILGGTIFQKVPIWNKYLGGAVMGCLFIGAFLVYFNAIPKDGDVYKSIKTWFNTQGFLDFYISVVLICSVLVVPRKILLQALGGFIVILAIGSMAGVGTGIIGGLMVGYNPKQTIVNYTLPILGGGNGAGAVPMSQIIGNNWGEKVGGDWYSKAVAITVIANIFSILFAAILSGVGRSKPELSGNGNLTRSNIHVIEDKPQIKDRNIAAALVTVLGIYVFSTIISNQILTKDRIHVTLPNYAWMIVICLLMNVTNIVPGDMKAGMEKIQTFISKQTTWLVMLAIGITSIDLSAFVKALTGQTLLITLLTVIGAVGVPMFLAKLFKFYPVEAGITAGCCMTAQGGAGVIAVLGASNRTQLMPYGQISTRIGGSVVLIIASVIFSAWNPALYM